MKIAKETWVILAIGIADLATTIIFIRHHGAQEANPLFSRYWQMGLPAFITAKMALLIAPLAILEWARVRRPRFVSWALRGAIVAYLAMYCVGYARLNPPVPPDADVALLEVPPIGLPQHGGIHLRPVSQAIRQTTSAATPEGITAY